MPPANAGGVEDDRVLAGIGLARPQPPPIELGGRADAAEAAAVEMPGGGAGGAVECVNLTAVEVLEQPVPAHRRCAAGAAPAKHARPPAVASPWIDGPDASVVLGVGAKPHRAGVDEPVGAR